MSFFQVYTFNDDTYALYRLVSEVSEEREVVCARQILTEGWKPHLNIPNFSAVGIFKYNGLSPDNVYVKVSEFKGKVVKVSDFVVTVPFNVLEETY